MDAKTRQRIVKERKEKAGLVKVSASAWVCADDATEAKAAMLRAVDSYRDTADDVYSEYVSRSHK